MEFHEIANLFPMMTPDEFAGLKEDINRNGQIDPVWIHDGKIIDGRNRYLACTELGIETLTRKWNGNGDLVDFVVSMNVIRRHLSAGQKAFIALGILDHYAEQAKERMLSGKADPREIIPQGTARDQAGDVMGVSGRYVSRAKRIAEQSPLMADQCTLGWLSLPKAEEILAIHHEGLKASVQLLFLHWAELGANMKVEEVIKHIGLCGLWHETEHMDAEWLLHHFGDPSAETWRKWGHIDSFHIPFSAYACKAPHEKPYAGCRTCYPETLTFQPVSATMNQLHREIMFHSAIAENLGKVRLISDVKT